MSSTRGFSLLEVLVALAVLAIALAATIKATGDQSALQAQMRDDLLARWVGANVVAEARLRETLPALGQREGRARMGGMEWAWRLSVSNTGEADIRRLDVQVFRWQAEGEAGDPEAVVTGFVSARERGP